ncbi:MAG: hypothetical protein A2087_10800 [Spirochaetes bacterium GWD1_61_31]|nr:MAG: hypothetical protein A2Y37_06530 [Spirochaetes bacterium GWB1_60_80]OHD30484.1 MAG: hypothetical protein A2004_08050 [Spirochaetes bacterium GWC1_61_12]OHD37912.1 MAG: hypothetical protein A2087_10800 [Spirochaetes bacterium GWD1_61_31]OHD44438.1 MAG: hypothetical protein A2Y35_09945 [Spirochaetes bacterium GWE1_60_18]OHD60949.1 MAG: hypothetical protein A2Y32_11550 [Spirochaetes bacterium GWF1_60_12]
MVWVILSSVIGGIVLLRELEEIDSILLDLTEEETTELRMLHGLYLSDPSQDHLDQIRSELASHISDGHFIIINLYNAEKRLILSVKNTAEEPAVYDSEESKPVLLFGPDAQFRRFLGKYGQVFLLVFVPLKEDSASMVGYFEAVYKVDEGTINSIKDRIFISLSQVIIIIFITALSVYPVIILLNRKVLRVSQDLSRANIGLLKSLGSAVAKRDSDTNSHNYRVTILSTRLAEEVGLRKDLVAGLINGSFLHDVGKIAIQDSILLKPGRLTLEETKIMQSHVSHGIDIVKHYHGLESAASIIRHHHEKYDGSGYPAGLSGQAIPLPARIFAIADVFDALISKRPYKDAFSLEESLRIIRSDSGIHFDPELVEAFCRIATEEYQQLMLSDDENLNRILDNLIEKYHDSL